MKESADRDGSERLQRLRNLLTHLRQQESSRLRDLRRDQAQDAVTEPTDDLELARGEEELELHASLVARTEDRLKAIELAFERLDQETYGICERCKQEIALERLMTLPFALYCADCQKARLVGREVGTMDEQFLVRWDVPEGMVETLGSEDLLKAPQENARPLGTEAFAAPPSVPKAPLPRKKPKRSRKGRES